MKKRTVIALAALSLMAVSGTTVFAATKPVMETEDTADSELFMPGEIKEDAEEAEFEGNWKAVEVGIDKSIASLDTIGFDSVYATAEDGKVNVYVKMTLLDNLLKIEDADYDYQDGTNSFDISDMAVDSGKTIRDAEKIKTDQSHDNGCPDKGTAFLFQEKSDNRDNDNIAGSDKSCTSDRCILDAHLLKTAGKCQKNTAADTAENQCTGLFCLLLRRWQFLFLVRFSVIQKENAWNQDDSSDDASNSVESKRTHVIHTNTLGYESHPPDGGCQQQKQRIFKLCLFHKIPSLHM